MHHTNILLLNVGQRPRTRGQKSIVESISRYSETQLGTSLIFYKNLDWVIYLSNITTSVLFQLAVESIQISFSGNWSTALRLVSLGYFLMELCIS